MALSDCAKCWETPCVCGHEYKDWSVSRLTEFIETLQSVLKTKLEKETVSSFPHLMTPLPHYKSAMERWNEMTLEEQEKCSQDLIKILWKKK
jgi:hypothetical protein